MKISYIHYRVPQRPRRKTPTKGKPQLKELHQYNQSYPNFIPAPRGGLTICQIISDNCLVFQGAALCSYSDTFNYTRGRELAKERALNQMVKYALDG